MAADQDHIDSSDVPSNLPAYTLGPKLSLQEYENLDAEDDSLTRYKRSLGIGVGKPLPCDPNDKRTVHIKSLTFLPEGRSPTVFDLTTEAGLKALKAKPFTIKEGSTFRLQVVFSVFHHILSGLKYVQTASRLMIPNTTSQMIGSYPVSTEDKPTYTMTFDAETVPSGPFVRGVYKVVSKFVDDDKVVHLQFDWAFEIKKDWDN